MRATTTTTPKKSAPRSTTCAKRARLTNAWPKGNSAMRMSILLIVTAFGTLSGEALAASSPRFGLDDMARLADVAAPDLSPDGEALAYSVSTVNAAEDLAQSDLWRVAHDGSKRVQLTRTPKHSE